MSISISPKFSEKCQFCDIELFTFGTKVVKVLWFPEFTLPVERTHIVKENSYVGTLRCSAFVPFLSQIAVRQTDCDQTMLVCEHHQVKHGTSCPSLRKNRVSLDRLESVD